MGRLLVDPVGYFREFGDSGAKLWIALGTFFLLALAEAVGAGAWPGPGDWPFVVVMVGLNWLFQIVLFGVVWFFLGAKVLGGKAGLGTTVRAVGYAFFFPATLGLGVSVANGWSDSATGGSLPLIAIHAALSLWALCLAAIAVKHTHGLSWKRMALVMLWLPTLMGMLVGGALLLVVLLGLTFAG